MLVEPNRPWRILNSEKHSTVWDGEETLFELNFLALGVEPEDCFALASEGGRELRPGVYLRGGRVGSPDARVRLPRWRKTKPVHRRGEPRNSPAQRKLGSLAQENRLPARFALGRPGNVSREPLGSP